jgi:hypothetical protein
MWRSRTGAEERVTDLSPPFTVVTPLRQGAIKTVPNAHDDPDDVDDVSRKASSPVL